ncbi:MAG: class I SAM-dependent methyltransferase [Flavobacteriales bacterium]|jgi:hypothetical protein
MNIDFWNSRYGEEGFAYGAEPNRYFAEKLNSIEVGSLLLPAEGEGRQAVYAAKLGWKVTAFDPSDAGRVKAMTLAQESGSIINYDVCDANDFIRRNKERFDVVAFIYSHFPDADRVEQHQRLAQMVNPGGFAIVEVFAKGHTAYNSKDPRVGGPREESMLFSEIELIQLLDGFDMLESSIEEVQLNEGKYHVGRGLVLRALARKRGVTHP